MRNPNGSNASWALDPIEKPSPHSPASARIDIQGTAPSADGIDLSQIVIFENGGYQLSFWARASRDDTHVELNARKNGGDWHNLGLDLPAVLSSQWAQYNVTFLATADGSQGRLSWFAGKALPNTSIWINSPTLVGVDIPLPVFVREFECGAVVLNGDTSAHTVVLNTSSLRRLEGQQAPRWQYIVDDNSTAFQPLTGGDWVVKNFDSGYHGDTTPSQEEVRPANGFYYHWARGAAEAPAGSSASFALNVPAAGIYNVSMWWPAAVPARAAWSTAMRITISPGNVQTTVDLSVEGGDEFFPVASAVQLIPSSTLLVECPVGGGGCIADAVLLESSARYNDGAAAPLVELAPLDAIVLQKTAGLPASCKSSKKE